MRTVGSVSWLLMGDPAITVRRASDADLDAVIGVGTVALGWDPGAPNAMLFRWKHLANPFGRSPIWIAEVDGEIAGYRALMRWELVDRTGRIWKAVRAVDTATHPDYQRRGIFSQLTMRAVEDMATEGVDIVFNTPNERSRPGYLKMGWIDVGRLPTAVRPTRLRALPRLLAARTSAEKWSDAITTGDRASDVLGDNELDDLLASQPPESGLATVRSADLFRWRYGLEELHYRAWCPSGLAGGVVLFRVRRRGSARECAIGHVLVPDGDRRRSDSLLRGLRRTVTADYLLRLGRFDIRSGFLPLPGQGPRLTARKVTTEPPADMADWDLGLGDIELF